LFTASTNFFPYFKILSIYLVTKLPTPSRTSTTRIALSANLKEAVTSSEKLG
jgi:hypothetical protein